MNNHRPKIAVLGAGNGGQAFAGYLSSRGYTVRLWNRSRVRLEELSPDGHITLTDALQLRARVELATTSLDEAIEDAQVILITTTADAHYDLAVALAPLLQEGQVVLLNPGRTGGALEFRHIIGKMGCTARVYIAEAQSLVFACRITAPAQVRIIGVKQYVPVAAFPAADTEHVLSRVRPMFGCFVAAPNVLHTGLENIGAVFHPAIVMFNAAAIERGDEFYFYQDMTDSVAAFLMRLDRERLRLGRAFGIHLASIFDWIKMAYPDCIGKTLAHRMRNNPAYHEIRAPSCLSSRLLVEDIPTGLVPFAALGQAASLDMPLTRSLIHMASALLDVDFWTLGRNLEKLNLAGLTLTGITAYVQGERD